MKSIGLSVPVTTRDGLGEQVEPRRVEPAAEGQVGGEPPAILEGREVVRPDDQQDVLGVAGDQVHDGAHVAGSVARPSA